MSFFTQADPLEAISLPPATGNPTYQLVALHGWGANSEDLLGLRPHLPVTDWLCWFPNAPYRHPLNPVGRAWYNIESPNYDGLDQGKASLYQWLKDLPDRSGIPLDRTFLLGFSQGGAMTLDLGINSDLPFLGLCSLSGYLHFNPQGKHPQPPLLMVHGTHDQRIPLAFSHQSRDALIAADIRLDYQELPMEHTISLEALERVGLFIQNLIT